MFTFAMIIAGAGIGVVFYGIRQLLSKNRNTSIDLIGITGGLVLIVIGFIVGMNSPSDKTHPVSQSPNSSAEGNTPLRETVWERLAESEKATFFYDINNIQSPSKNIKRVWQKTVAPEFEVDGIKYKLFLYEYDCAKGTYSIQDIAYFDSKGNNVSDTVGVAQEKYMEALEDSRAIVPGSVEQAAYMKICR